MCVGWQVGRSVYRCAGHTDCAAGAVTEREHWGEDCRGDFLPVRVGRHVRHGYC